MNIIDRFEFSESKVWLRVAAVVAALIVAASLLALIVYLMSNGTSFIKHTPAATTYVEVNDQGFNPSVLAVRPNTNIIWVNKSSGNVRVIALPLEKGDKSLFDSGETPIKPGENFSITIKKGVGVTIKYQDQLHPERVGGVSIVDVVPQ